MSSKLITALVVAIAFAVASPAADADADAVDYITRLETNEQIAQALGLSKLSTGERAAWNRIINAAFAAGADSVKPQSEAPSTAVPRPHRPLAPPAASFDGKAWRSKADLDGGGIVKLANGAVFEVAIGFTGYGFGREVVLLQEGSKWTLWVEGKSEYSGALLRRPTAAPPLGFRRTFISSVSSNGEIVALADRTVYEIEGGDRISTSLWLPSSDVIVLQDDSIINPGPLLDGLAQGKRLR